MTGAIRAVGWGGRRAITLTQLPKAKAKAKAKAKYTSDGRKICRFQHKIARMLPALAAVITGCWVPVRWLPGAGSSEPAALNQHSR